MALNKTVTMYGQSWTYHRMTNIKAIRNSKKMVLVFDMYKDQATRDADINNCAPNPLMIQCDGADYDTYFDSTVLDGLNVNALKQGYKFAKEKNKPENKLYEATDVLE